MQQKDSRSSTESVSSSENETVQESDSNSYEKRRKMKSILRRQSLQVDSGSSLMARIDKKQTARAIMKRISVEIM